MPSGRGDVERGRVGSTNVVRGRVSGVRGHTTPLPVHALGELVIAMDEVGDGVVARGGPAVRTAELMTRLAECIACGSDGGEGEEKGCGEG